AFKELKIDIAGEFIVMAANLIYLKSRSLLPLDQQPPEEDVDEDDPRWDLIRQLIEYKKFKEAAVQLHDRALEQEHIFTRDSESVLASDTPLPLHEVGIFQLIHAFQEVVKRVAAREDFGEIFAERFSVSDKIEKILERIGNGASVRFSELFGQIASRVEIVVTFLALLELIRLNQVRALQRNMFDDIEIAAVAAAGIDLMPRGLIAGCGYRGRAIAELLAADEWQVEGWTMSAESAQELSRRGR